MQIGAAGTDETKCLAVVEAYAVSGDAIAKQLKALNSGPQHVTIQLAAPTTQQVDVNAAVTKVLADRDAATAAAQTTLAAKLKLLSDTIADGDKTLTPEGVKKFAEDYAPLVDAGSTDAKVKHLATLAVAQAKALSVAHKLTSLGYNPVHGVAHISVDSSNSIKALQATTDQRLGLTNDKDTRRFASTGGELLMTNKAFAEKCLAEFDAEHGAALDAEHKRLTVSASCRCRVRPRRC